MAQWCTALVALAEDPALILSTHRVVYGHPQLQFQGVSCPFLNSKVSNNEPAAYIDRHACKTLTYKINK